LSFVAPVFTMLLLALPRPALNLKAGLGIVLLIVVSVHAGLLFLPLLLHQRWAGILLLTLALFGSFYFTARGGAAVLGMLITVALTLAVTVGSVSIDAVLLVAQGVSIGAFVGVVFVWLAYAILPDPAPAQETAKPGTPSAKPAAHVARRSALRSLAIVLPVVVLFLFSSASAAYTPVMIKIASMGQQVTTDQTRAAARSLLTSTLIGGVAAIIAWQVLSITPHLAVYVLLIALAGLLFGPRIFSNKGMHEQAATWSYGYLTMVVILAPAVMDKQFGSGAGVAFTDRLLMFVWATLYAVAAVVVFDAFWPAAKEKIEVTKQ